VSRFYPVVRKESTNHVCRDEFVICATKIELDRRFQMGFVAVFNQRRAPGTAAIADDLLPH